MKIYSVQRTTVRRGLDLLSLEGYIKKAAGLGSIVRSKTPSEVQTEIDEVHSTNITKTSSFCHSLLLPDKDVDKLPEVVLDLIVALSSNNVFMTSGKEELSSDSRVICVDTNGEPKQPACYALLQSDDYRSVVLDNDKSAYIALTYLENLGHSKIAFVGTNSGLSFENALYDSFSAVNSYFDENLCYLGSSDEKCGFDGFSELFRRHGRNFTAVCAANDAIAKGIIKAAKYYKLNVPEDISVISLCSSKNSDVDAIFYDTGALASEILYSLDNHTRIATVLFSGSLSVKGTSTSIKESSQSEKNMSDFLL
jgi:hypothetical protein